MICFHPRHDLTLARMEVGDIVKVIEEWKRVYVEEGKLLRSFQSDLGSGKGESEEEGYVQIFEVSFQYARSSNNARITLKVLEPRSHDGC